MAAQSRQAEELESHFDTELLFSHGYDPGSEFPGSFAVGDTPNVCDAARDRRTRGWWEDMTLQDQQTADEWLERWNAWEDRKRCVEILRRYGYWVCRGRPTLDLGPPPQRPPIENTARRLAEEQLGPGGVERLAQQFEDDLRQSMACEQRPCPGGAPCRFVSKVVFGRGIDWKAKRVYFDVQVYARCTCGQEIQA